MKCIECTLSAMIMIICFFQEEFPFMSARDNNFVFTRISIYVIRGISLSLALIKHT